jgi:hypothetical protein
VATKQRRADYLDVPPAAVHRGGSDVFARLVVPLTVVLILVTGDRASAQTRTQRGKPSVQFKPVYPVKPYFPAKPLVPLYVAPKPVFVTPKPLIFTPKPIFVAPQPVFFPPKPVFGFPSPSWYIPGYSGWFSPWFRW